MFNRKLKAKIALQEAIIADKDSQIDRLSHEIPLLYKNVKNLQQEKIALNLQLKEYENEK
jgi:hypothetical protein